MYMSLSLFLLSVLSLGAHVSRRMCVRIGALSRVRHPGAAWPLQRFEFGFLISYFPFLSNVRIASEAQTHFWTSVIFSGGKLELVCVCGFRAIADGPILTPKMISVESAFSLSIYYRSFLLWHAHFSPNGLILARSGEFHIWQSENCGNPGQSKPDTQYLVFLVR